MPTNIIQIKEEVMKRFEKEFKCNCILCKENNHEFNTTYNYMKSFLSQVIDDTLEAAALEVEKEKSGGSRWNDPPHATHAMEDFHNNVLDEKLTNVAASIRNHLNI